MESNTTRLAEMYYTYVGEKNFDGVAGLLHQQVELFSPLAAVHGKDAVFKATCNYMSVLTKLVIREKFGEGDKAVIIYNVDIANVTEDFPAVSFLTFKDGLIIRIELFYDARLFTEKKEEIFSK